MQNFAECGDCSVLQLATGGLAVPYDYGGSSSSGPAYQQVGFVYGAQGSSGEAAAQEVAEAEGGADGDPFKPPFAVPGGLQIPTTEKQHRVGLLLRSCGRQLEAEAACMQSNQRHAAGFASSTFRCHLPLRRQTDSRCMIDRSYSRQRHSYMRQGASLSSGWACSRRKIPTLHS